MMNVTHRNDCGDLSSSPGMGEGIVGQYLSTRRLAAGSLRHMRHTLGGFVSVVGDDPAKITAEGVEEWWQTQHTMAVSTARLRHSTVGVFLRWCRHRGLMAHDPLAHIPRPREPRRSPVTLTDDELRKLLAAVPDLRGDAVVKMMLWMGLRAVDVHRLEVADWDQVAQVLTVHGKGGRVDPLPVPTTVATALRRYLRQHPATAGPLIRAYDSPVRALSAQRISEMVAAWFVASGVKQTKWDGRSGHALRRTCATDLLRRGVNVRDVQAVLRHESLSTTEKYLARTDCEDLRDALERAVV
jgi:integrase/recombinase XerD